MSQALVMPTYDQQADCLDYFQQMILSGLSYWQEHAALQSMDVPILDKERDGILSALNRGLEFDQAWPLALALIDKLAAYMERRGYWTAWRAVLEKAIATSQRVGDIQGETTMTALLARLSQRQSHGKDVLRYYWRAMKLAKQSNNQYEYARSCCNLGYYYIDASRWWRAEVLSLRALEIFEALESEHGLAHTYSHLGALYTRQRRWSEAKEYLKEACTLWQKIGDEHGIVRGYDNLSVLLIEMGQPLQALTWLEKAHRQVSRLGDKAELGNILLNMGIAYQGRGDLAQAKHHFLQAKDVYHHYNNRHGLALVWRQIGILELRDENFVDARTLLQNSRALCNSLNEVDNELNAIIHLIECEIMEGKPAHAEPYFNEARNLLLCHNLGEQGTFFTKKLDSLEQTVFGSPN